MAISEVISNFAGAVSATREKLREINQKIDALKGERDQIARAKPHADDIIAAFRASLDGVTRNFEVQLAERLTETFVKADNAAEYAKRPPFELLRLEPKPSQAEIQTRSMKGSQAELSVLALTYFLREQIASELPGLVERLCPTAQQGLRAGDRAVKLSELDAQIAALEAERDALNEDISAAHAALRPSS